MPAQIKWRGNRGVFSLWSFTVTTPINSTAQPRTPPAHPPPGSPHSSERAAQPSPRGAVIGTAKSFSVPSALFALLPPPYRVLALVPSAALWTKSQDRHFLPPAQGKGVFTDDVLKYAPFIPALGLQTALNSPQTATGKRLAGVDKAWRAMCEKAPFMQHLSASRVGAAVRNAITAYPVSFVSTRVAGQLAAGYSGALLAREHGSTARAEQAEKRVPGAGTASKKADKSRAEGSGWLRFAPAVLFSVPMLAYSAPGRAAIASRLGLPASGKFSAAMTDMVGTSSLVGAAVSANSVRRSDWFQQLESGKSDAGRTA